MGRCLSNYMEEVVEILVDRAIKNLNICKCKKCKSDIIALTLNKFSAKYIVTNKGFNFTKLQQMGPQSEVDVIAEIARAAEVVGKNPKHNVV